LYLIILICNKSDMHCIGQTNFIVSNWQGNSLINAENTQDVCISISWSR